MRIWIREEFGYRDWLWTFDGTKEEVLLQWKLGRAPISFFGIRQQKEYDGKCEEYYPDNLNDYYNCDIYAHVHMSDDTMIEIDGKTYDIDGKEIEMCWKPMIGKQMISS